MKIWRNKRILMMSFTAILAAAAHSETMMEPSRGELLYSTHCIACHTANAHWRDKREVKDWKSLNKEVRRWAESISLGWSMDDVVAVSSYLNAVYYHLPSAKEKELVLTK